MPALHKRSLPPVFPQGGTATYRLTHLYRYRPSGAANVVLSRQSGWSFIWWNAMSKLSLLKTFVSEISCNVSSTVGTGCFPRIARFACLVSKEMRMSLLGYSTATSGLIQLVALLTFSMTCSSCNCFNFAITFFCPAKWYSAKGLCHRWDDIILL